MVEPVAVTGMAPAWWRWIVEERSAIDGGWERRAWIVEDDPAVATLAAELCVARGASPSVFSLPLPFLTALRSSAPPAVLILDWRLENELTSGLFMATRHRYPRLPIICWTGSRTESLPSMIRADAYTVVVAKTSGTSSIERALGWALGGGGDAAAGSAPPI
jgi:DNA-binding NtrC family response regulator